MTTIRTTCPRCGEVDMAPRAIRLSVPTDSLEGSYRFTCPSCSVAVEKGADRKIVALLVSVGVDVDRFASRAASDAPVRPQGDNDDAAAEEEGFDLDDIIEFHFLLRDERRFWDVMEGQGPSGH